MGKNKRRQIECFDETHNIKLSVDSQEEYDFINWLDEAKKLNIINDYIYQPTSFQLFDPVKYIDIDKKEKSLFQKHIYSPDFLITFDGNKQQQLAKELKINYNSLSTECSAWVDTKGTFNNNARSFNTDRKWVWQKFNIFINEIIPIKWFTKFGVPEKSKLSPKKKQPRKCFLGLSSIFDIFKININ